MCIALALDILFWYEIKKAFLTLMFHFMVNQLSGVERRNAHLTGSKIRNKNKQKEHYTGTGIERTYAWQEFKFA